MFEASDAVIDFSAPAATAGYAQQAAAAGVALVTGTTGLAFEEQAAVQKAAETVCIVQSANFSLGVNLLLALTHKAAKALDESFDIEILELHHNHKADAPSGTALALGRAAAEGRNVVLDDVADRARDGITGARRPGDIGFASLRGGTAAGDHTVLFAGPKERIELTHRAEDRAIFATGAVAARVPGRVRRFRAVPARVEPVKDTMSTSGCDDSCVPTPAPSPFTRLKTPGGKPASCTSSAKINALSGLCSEGFSTMVQPAIAAAPNFSVIWFIGQFHGVISAATPTAS